MFLKFIKLVLIILTFSLSSCAGMSDQPPEPTEQEKAAQKKKYDEINAQKVLDDVRRIMETGGAPIQLKERAGVMQYYPGTVASTQLAALMPEVQTYISEYEAAAAEKAAAEKAYWNSPEGRQKRLKAELQGEIVLASDSLVQQTRRFELKSPKYNGENIEPLVIAKMGVPKLYLSFNFYSSSDWLFMKSAAVLCGGKKFEFNWDYDAVVRDTVYGGGISEKYLAQAVGQYKKLADCIANDSNQVYVRYDGSDYYHEYEYQKSNQKLMRLMMLFVDRFAEVSPEITGK